MHAIKLAALALALVASTGLAQAQKKQSLKGKKVSPKVERLPDQVTVAKDPAPGQLDKTLPKGTTPYIQKEEGGQINWTMQYIEAEGESVLDNERFKNPAQAKAMAVRGATVVAQRNLLEIVKGVNVTSETTVEDMITTKDIVITRIDGVVKGAQIVGAPIVADGSVKVRLRMPLYAANGLAPVVYDGLHDTPQADPNTLPATEGMQLNPANSPQVTDANTSATGTVPNNAIAFNMNGKPFDPALFPVVTDEQGNVLLNTKGLYDPKSGKFPQILNTTKDVLQTIGFKKGVEVLDVLSAEDGKIKISDASKSKIDWSGILKTGLKVLKFLLL